MLLLFTPLLPALAQETVPLPRVSVEVGTARTPQEVSTSLQILAILTLLSVAPSILLMMTAFTRIVIVLSFLKSALGTPPPNTNRASEVHQLPPSFRFPPLREGNRERRTYSVPPACRGNLKEGVINCCFF